MAPVNLEFHLYIDNYFLLKNKFNVGNNFVATCIFNSMIYLLKYKQFI